jgi:hypothetical protein
MAAMDVANEIHRQIGMQALMATGARNFLGDAHSLHFRVGSGTRLSTVVVRLDPNDTYTVTYTERGNRSPYRVLTERAVSGIYAEQLGRVIRDLQEGRARRRRRRSRRP